MTKMLKEYRSSAAQKQGVKFPKQGTQKFHTLKYFYEKKGTIIKKSQAEKEICESMNIQSKDLQSLRHLGKQDGFDILQCNDLHEGYLLKKGEYVFRGFDGTNAYWNHKRRDDTGLDFDSCKKKYDFQCATCGAKKGQPHRYTKQIVTLERGHLDPRLPMSDENIIPQCSYCNQIAKGKFVFDKCGFVKWMTIEGLLSHSVKDQMAFYKILKEKFQ